MDIGQLWVTLGVNLAGLNAAYAAFSKLEGVAINSLGKVTAASETSARTQMAVEDRLLLNRIIRFDRFETAAKKSAAKIVAVEEAKAAKIVVADERALLSRIQAFNRYEAKVVAIANAAAAAQTAAANSAANAQIALDNKLMLQRIKAVATRIAAEEKIAAAKIAAGLQADALFDKLAAKEMLRQEKVIAAQIAASARAAQAQIVASSASSAATVANVNRMSLAFTRFGQSLTMYVTAPLLLIGYSVVKAITTIDALEHKIVALTNTSKSQMNTWRSDIIRMSDETNVSAKDITESFYFVANSALSAGTTLKIVEMAAKASAIGMGTASDVGKALTFVYNSYGESAFNAAKTMDILTIAVREGVVEINQLIPVIGPILPFAAKLGVSFDQVASSLVIMTRTGFSAARASTSVRALLQGLADPAPGAQRSLKAMGTSFEELRAIIRDKGLVGALIKIDEIINKFGETASGEFLKNIRAEMGALGQIGPQLLASIEVAKKAKDEAGAFARAWEISKTSVKFSLEGVKVAFQKIFLSIGGTGGGLIRFFDDLKGRLNSVANWFKALTPAMQQHYIHMALWAAAIGPLVIFVGNLVRIIGGLYNVVVWLFAPWTKLIFVTKLLIVQLGYIASGYMSMMAVIGITNPWIAAAIAIGLVTAALLAYFSANKKVSETQQAILDVNKEITASVVAEKVKLEQLMRIYTSQNTSTEQILKARNAIIAIAPEFLSAFDKEGSSLQDNIKLINTYIEVLTKEAEIKAIINQIVATKTNNINDVASGADRAISTWQKFKAGFSLGNMIQVDPLSKSVQGFEDTNAEKKRVSALETIAVLQKRLDLLTGVTKAEETLNAVSVHPSGPTEAQKKALLDAANASQKANEGLLTKRQEFVQSYNESYNSIIAKANILGDTVLDNGKKFDKADALNSLYFSTMENGFKIFEEGNPFMNAIVANVFMLSGAADFTSAAMKKMNEELASSNSQYTVSGDKVEWLTDKINILKNTSKNLSSGGVTGGIDITKLKKDILSLSQELSGVTLTKSLADAAVNSSLLGGSFDILGAKTVAYQSNLTALKNLYDLAKENNDEFSMSLIKGIIAIDKTELNVLNLAKTMKIYTDATNLTHTSSQAFGRNFEYTAARIKDTENLVNSLISSVSTLTGNNEDATATQLQLNEAMSTLHLLNITKATQDYSKALEENAQQALTAGKSYNLSGENLKAQIVMLKAVRNEIDDVTSATYAHQSDEIANAEKSAKGNFWSGGDIKKGLSSVQSSFSSFASSYTSMLDAQQNRALTLIEKTGKALNKSDKWIAKEKEKIDQEFHRKKKQAALAEIAINTAIGISRIWAQSGINIPLAVISTALLVASMGMQISAVNAAQMAKGGIVPSGYSNDSYPAMLTSGEVVVPPSKLNILQGKPTDTREKEFKQLSVTVKGRDLEYIFKEQYKLNNSF